MADYVNGLNTTDSALEVILPKTVTSDNFRFYDSERKIKETKSLSAPLFIAIAWFAFFGVFCTIGTLTDMYNRKLKTLQDRKNSVVVANMDPEGGDDMVLASPQKKPSCLNNFVMQFSVIYNMN